MGAAGAAEAEDEDSATIAGSRAGQSRRVRPPACRSTDLPPPECRSRMVCDPAGAGQQHGQRLIVEAGWCAILRVPVMQTDEELVGDLLRRKSVLVHPGHFY